MSAIRSGVGLVSGINSAQVIDALITLQRAPILRLEGRVVGLQTTSSALKSLEATLLSITTSIQQIGLESTFTSFETQNSDSAQISVRSNSEATPGTYHFQAVREASTQSQLSRGYANADQQTIGTGTLVIATGGQLHQPTLLDALNSGNGIGRGKIQITDRSGVTAEIDLSDAHTVDDVLDAINGNADLSVTATTHGDHLVITDTSGATTSDLIVADLNNGHAAEDLGIAGSVSADTLTGTSVYEATDGFTLGQINDGNGLRRFKGAPDIRITLTDDSTFEVNLDDAVTLADVVNTINDHEDNAGKLSAALVNGRLELTDLTGGGGSSAFTVEDINSSSVVRQLGLNVAAVGSTISGQRLVAGLNSVLLRNLRGGQGIDQLGQISLTDRAGVSTTIDLTGAESLDEVINAINAAENGGTKLQITARVNETGTGIEIEDTSGASASNLIIADVAGSTLAQQLGIEVDAAQNSIDSGRLDFRYVNEATSVSNYAPDGNAIEPGSIRIVDSAGNSAVIEISEAVKNIGDVIQRINATSGISVTAALNDTGDGLVLIDEAGGSGVLTVEEVDGNTAGDLRLLGDAVLGTDGKYRINSRFAAVIDVEADDTLDSLVQKINDAAGFVNASVFDDGSAFNSSRLSLTSTTAGSAGRLVIDDGGLGLDLSVLTEGEDALLRVGPNLETAFLIASSSNTFEDAASGIDVTVRQSSTKTAEVTVSRDHDAVENALESFVDNYNTFISTADNLTSYDVETNTRGVLQGLGIVLRVRNRLDSLMTRQFFGDSETYQSLVDMGIRIGEGGKLEFDKNRLTDALNENPQAVADFFQTEEEGFVDRAEAVVDSLTDPFTGTFILEENALNDSIQSLTARIEQLDQILEGRRERLIREFSNMETILSELSSQQQALFGLSTIANG